MDELGVLYNSIPCNARTVANAAITSVMKPQRASASYVWATLDPRPPFRVARRMDPHCRLACLLDQTRGSTRQTRDFFWTDCQGEQLFRRGSLIEHTFCQ